METLPSTVVTTEAIKKICVKLGFYRNPVCNEKLYLHHRGFDSFEEDAFDPYTDVKVLWLEGNAFSHIPCGKDSMPRQKKQQQQQSFVSQENTLNHYSNVGCSKSAQLEGVKNLYVDACADMSAFSMDVDNACKERIQRSCVSTNVSFVSSAVHEEGKKDVFQSLYPTLRQLFLHNNALREMPDISGFQRLDTINLSCNCIHAVRANCAAFAKKEAKFKQMIENKKSAILLNSKVMQKESFKSGFGDNVEATEEQTQYRDLCHEGDYGSVGKGQSFAQSAGRTTNVVGANCNENCTNISEPEKLDMWRQLLNEYAIFCPHEPLAATQNGRLSDVVPPEHRNPCSSVRTLNLSNNYISAVADTLELLCFKNLSTLDLSGNQLDDGEALLLVLERLPQLRLLKLSGNPLVRRLPRYRKRVLACCTGLLHLDETPVFANERRLVTAWARGGDEEERKERARIKQELEEQHLRRLKEFRAIVGRYRAAGQNTSTNNSNSPGVTENEGTDVSLEGELSSMSNTRIMERQQQHGTFNAYSNADNDDVTSSEKDEEDEQTKGITDQDNHQESSSHQAMETVTSNVFNEQEQNPMPQSEMSSSTLTTRQTLFVSPSVAQNDGIRQRQINDDDDDIYIPSVSR